MQLTTRISKIEIKECARNENIIFFYFNPNDYYYSRLYAGSNNKYIPIEWNEKILIQADDLNIKKVNIIRGETNIGNRLIITDRFYDAFDPAVYTVNFYDVDVNTASQIINLKVMFSDFSEVFAQEINKTKKILEVLKNDVSKSK